MRGQRYAPMLGLRLCAVVAVLAVVAVGAVIVIGVVRFGAVIIADAARSVEIIYDEDGNVVSLEWASADTDAEMVPADAIANPNISRRRDMLYGTFT